MDSPDKESDLEKNLPLLSHEGQLLVCSVCYDEQSDQMEEEGLKFISLAKCGHQFCSSCFSEFFRSLIEDQNQHDKLRCPQQGCSVIPSEVDLKSIVTPEVFEKFLSFKKRQEVAQNSNLQFCPSPDCEHVFDLRKTKAKKLDCPACQLTYCSECSSPYHGDRQCTEDKAKQAQLIIKASGVDVNKCPRCKVIYEKNGGCPHMVCPICGYSHCWVCGFSSDSFFHFIQVREEETGVLCKIIQDIYHIKYPFLRYLVLILALIFLPFGAFILISIIPSFLVVDFLCRKFHERLSKSMRCVVAMPFLVFLYVVCAPIVAISSVVAAIYSVLLYLIELILVLRIITRHIQAKRKMRLSKDTQERHDKYMAKGRNQFSEDENISGSAFILGMLR